MLGTKTSAETIKVQLLFYSIYEQVHLDLRKDYIESDPDDEDNDQSHLDELEV